MTNAESKKSHRFSLRHAAGVVLIVCTMFSKSISLPLLGLIGIGLLLVTPSNRQVSWTIWSLGFILSLGMYPFPLIPFLTAPREPGEMIELGFLPYLWGDVVSWAVLFAFLASFLAKPLAWQNPSRRKVLIPLGWVAVLISYLAADFITSIRDAATLPYAAQRLLPSLIMWLLFALTLVLTFGTIHWIYTAIRTRLTQKTKE